MLQSYKNIFSIYAAAAAQILAARIEQLESNEEEYTSLGIDSTSLLAELKALQDALPPTYDRAQQIDDDPVAGAARPRIAIETAPPLDERVEDGVDPDPPPPATS